MSRTGRREALARYLTEAFTVGGVARRVGHGQRYGGPADQFAARAAGQEQLSKRHDPDGSVSEPERLIDRIPGAALLLFVAIVVVVVYLVGR